MQDGGMAVSADNLLGFALGPNPWVGCHKHPYNTFVIPGKPGVPVLGMHQSVLGPVAEG